MLGPHNTNPIFRIEMICIWMPCILWWNTCWYFVSTIRTSSSSQSIACECIALSHTALKMLGPHNTNLIFGTAIFQSAMHLNCFALQYGTLHADLTLLRYKPYLPNCDWLATFHSNLWLCCLTLSVLPKMVYMPKFQSLTPHPSTVKGVLQAGELNASLVLDGSIRCSSDRKVQWSLNGRR